LISLSKSPSPLLHLERANSAARWRRRYFCSPPFTHNIFQKLEISNRMVFAIFAQRSRGSLRTSCPPVGLSAARVTVVPCERIAPTATALTFGSLVISSKPTSCLLEPMARVRRGRLPLNNYCSDDQQPEKDRQQYRRYEPLTNTESIGIRHLGPPFQNGGSATLSVTDNSQGTRGDMGDMVTLRRITRAGRSLIVVGRL